MSALVTIEALCWLGPPGVATMNGTRIDRSYGTNL